MRHVLLAALVVAPAVGASQTRVEVRADVVGTQGTTRQEAAFGVRTVVGLYLRAEASVGVYFLPDSTTLASPRIEAAFRFLLDPINERKWGLSFAGGLGYVDRRSYLLVAADLEGQPILGWRPAIRFALGGGVRLGLVLRRPMKDRRR